MGTWTRTRRLKAIRSTLVGEPVVVPRSEAQEDDAYLLVVGYEAESERGVLIGLDGDSLAEVFRLALPHPIPLGFHGCWAGGVER